MDKKRKKFYEISTLSTARILDERLVEVQAPDGEVFSIMCNVGRYNDEEYKRMILHKLEIIFDACFNHDKEKMHTLVWQQMMLNGIPFMGMSSGNRQGERTRIGGRIRQLREGKGMEARDLALLANVDAANLCRIEQGKYSVGLDILSRIAFALGAHIDLIPNQL